MLRLSILFISLLLCTRPPPARGIKETIRGASKFSRQFYKHASTDGANVFISPLSAHAVLSMLYQGADGSTAQQLLATLGLPDANTTVDEYRSILHRLQRTHSNGVLDIANKIFLEKKLQLHPHFKDVVAKGFLAEAEEIDFDRNTDAAASINGWVARKTHGKIRELYKPELLDARTKLLLVNALYFKDNWATMFDKSDTRKGTFHLSDGKTVPVELMSVKDDFAYGDIPELKARVLEMPYEDYDTSMLIILPRENATIKEVEEKLETVELNDILRKLWEYPVEVTFPKFTLASEINMNEILMSMGLNEIFSDKANLTKLTKDGEPLKVSEVLQKTVLEVNEKGAEAAAATVTRIVLRSGATRKTVEFKVDRPFLFAIVNKDFRDGTLVILSGKIEIL